MATVNACTFCKRRKRKCDKARPACSNCTRLRRHCEYSEDALVTPFRAKSAIIGANLGTGTALPALNPFDQASFPRAVLDYTLATLGSFDNLYAIANEFFITTHQRISLLSRHRFCSSIRNLLSSPRAELAILCLCIYLMQQMPDKERPNGMRSPLYAQIKQLIGLLELTENFTIDLLHCRLLITYYELGHGIHRAACLSFAASAKIARVIGLHKRPWQSKQGQEISYMVLEEQKRVWWAIVNLDRFMGLSHGETLLVTEDPDMSEMLPIEDLLWSEGSEGSELAALIAAPPCLDTPSYITLGQLARECQIAHIVGRLIRHMSYPTLDPEFNREECFQVERTLLAYIPLLAEEELRLGKYCSAFAMCNNALFILYEFKLNKSDGSTIEERAHILQCMEDVSLRCIAFAELSFNERIGSTLYEIHSPYCPYSLFQAAIVQYRIWKQTGDLECSLRINSMKTILREFGKRWDDSWRYLNILENLEGDWPSIIVHAESFGRS